MEISKNYQVRDLGSVFKLFHVQSVVCACFVD